MYGQFKHSQHDINVWQRNLPPRNRLLPLLSSTIQDTPNRRTQLRSYHIFFVWFEGLWLIYLKIRQRRININVTSTKWKICVRTSSIIRHNHTTVTIKIYDLNSTFSRSNHINADNRISTDPQNPNKKSLKHTQIYRSETKKSRSNGI